MVRASTRMAALGKSGAAAQPKKSQFDSDTEDEEDAGYHTGDDGEDDEATAVAVAKQQDAANGETHHGGLAGLVEKVGHVKLGGHEDAK